jgi:hypothetical protein
MIKGATSSFDLGEIMGPQSEPTLGPIGDSPKRIFNTSTYAYTSPRKSNEHPI